ncbi:hypothetical protein [Bacillus sp. AFS017336]|uniref:hypothetical protein n=1 Tax=Bacillus sp. AFS017336 TaxID=2033489 RepID=UPI0015CF60AE|nr:hypothetical protein [Bacillus sp. AFS017336]
MRLQCLCNFHAVGFLGHLHEVIEVTDHKQAIDLINFGFCQQVYEDVPAKKSRSKK